MLISTKGRYALRVMIDLAEHECGEFIPLKEVAKRQEISDKYLENIVRILTHKGLLQGQRGKGGGYKLTKDPYEYTVGSVLKAAEESISPVSCLQDIPNNCKRAKDCRTLPMWERLDTLLDEFFEGITIGELLNRV